MARTTDDGYESDEGAFDDWEINRMRWEPTREWDDSEIFGNGIMYVPEPVMLMPSYSALLRRLNDHLYHRDSGDSWEVDSVG
jgi:hypothetical protein